MVYTESQVTDMPWARFDDRYPSNRKIRKLSHEAFRLDVSGICWCNENLTDGFIPDVDLPFVCSEIRNPKKVAKELEDKQRWERLPGGWLIHDYFDYQPRAEQIRAARKAKTDRQRRWRDGLRDASVDGAVDASTDATHDAPTDASSDASRDGTEARAPRARVSHSPITTSSSSADADDAQTDQKPKHTRRGKQRVIPPRFDEFWALYPRKVGKIAAEQAFAKAIEAGADPQAVIDGALEYSFKRKGQDPQFTAHPTTWLNQGRWEDVNGPAYTPPVITGPSEAAGAMPPPISQVLAKQAAYGSQDNDPWSTPRPDPDYEPPF
jgi:hypothetical protein